MKEIRLLRADEIEVRLAQVNKRGASLLLYKTARTDMDILDETFGSENWKKSYELIDGQLFCTISVWDSTKEQWISKQDVGTESNTEAEKGRASDAFKRAGFNIGIGRELYTAPFIYYRAEELSEIVDDKKCYDKFEVISINYEGRKIVSVEVGNKTTGIIKTFGVFEQNGKKPAKKKDKTESDLEGSRLELFGLCKQNGVNPIWVAGKCNVNTINEMEQSVALRCVNHWDELVALYKKEMK